MNLKDLIPLGAAGSECITVTPEVTVAHYHSHLPPVYATPHMIHLLEITAGNVIAQLLPDGWVSVGAAIDVRHLAATPIGFSVTATAEVIEVTDSVIKFMVEAHDDTELIGRGTHVRAPVEFARFMKTVERKAAERR